MQWWQYGNSFYVLLDIVTSIFTTASSSFIRCLWIPISTNFVQFASVGRKRLFQPELQDCSEATWQALETQYFLVLHSESWVESVMSLSLNCSCKELISNERAAAFVCGSIKSTRELALHWQTVDWQIVVCTSCTYSSIILVIPVRAKFPIASAPEICRWGLLDDNQDVQLFRTAPSPPLNICCMHSSVETKTALVIWYHYPYY